MELKIAMLNRNVRIYFRPNSWRPDDFSSDVYTDGSLCLHTKIKSCIKGSTITVKGDLKF